MTIELSFARNIGDALYREIYRHPSETTNGMYGFLVPVDHTDRVHNLIQIYLFVEALEANHPNWHRLRRRKYRA